MSKGKGTAIAIVGVGKIARDQHIPAIAANPDLYLAATVTRHSSLAGIPNFTTLPELKAAMPEVSAIAICTPPRGRLDLVRTAVTLGLDVMIEKPPAATVTEAEVLVALAAGSDSVLYLTWHAREAQAVEAACVWLDGRAPTGVTVVWKEDVRVWHPGQEWIWEPGIGVFDPGINALSILTHILPGPLLLQSATLKFPANKPAPIAADLILSDASGTPVTLAFDFDQRGPQRWDITVQAEAGRLDLTLGGSRLAIDGIAAEVPEVPEYARLYARFAELIACRESDTDLSPFRLVADAFLLGEREMLGAFDWNG